MSRNLPDVIESEDVLDEVLTTPRPELVSFIKSLTSPLLILGAGGKMGPSLAVLAKRAADEARHPLEVIAASRYSDGGARVWLEARGVKTLVTDALEMMGREDVNQLPVFNDGRLAGIISRGHIVRTLQTRAELHA